MSTIILDGDWEVVCSECNLIFAAKLARLRYAGGGVFFATCPSARE